MTLPGPALSCLLPQGLNLRPVLLLAAIAVAEAAVIAFERLVGGPDFFTLFPSGPNYCVERDILRAFREVVQLQNDVAAGLRSLIIIGRSF